MKSSHLLFQIFFFCVFSLVLLYPKSASAKALPAFSFSVEATAESCPSNGELKFSVSQTEPSAVITYTIYLLPELNKPFKVQQASTLSSLRAGDYRIIATQEYNGESNSEQQDVTIDLTYEPTDFNIIAEDVCQVNDGRIQIEMVSGTASSYELQGPVNSGPQSSNIFEELSAGSYSVQVINECGSKTSQTFEILKTEFFIYNSMDFVPLLPECGKITVEHFIKPVGTEIQYPVTLEFTVNSPGGGEEVIRTVVEEGDILGDYVYGTIPFYNNEAYTYDIKVTDNCGNVASNSNIPVNRKLSVSEDMRWGAGGCGKRRLAISPINYSAPYSINFISYPEGFEPTTNSSYPGPFNDETTFFGDDQNPIPDGKYIFEVTDACGNTSDEIILDHTTIISRPSNITYIGCDPGLGSVQLSTWDYNMTLVEISKAPSTYPHSLPHDVTENVNKSNPHDFSMNNLPAGNYEFYVEDDCGLSHIAPVTIEDYEVTENQVEVMEVCSSFNIFLKHESNLFKQHDTFGLQKFDPETGSWGHPSTGSTYVEGEELDKNNSILLSNDAMNYNFPFSGTFRVVKSFRLWKNGSDITSGEDPLTYCLNVLKEFTIDPYTIGLTGINSFTCSGDLFDVAISATGYEPLRYKIISKDGTPFLSDNGNNPLFQGLEEGVYTFEIEDNCKNILTRALHVSDGYEPRIIPNNLCHGENGELAVFGLDFLEFEWWKDDDPATILSNGPSLSFSPFDANSDPGIYKVEIKTDNANSCSSEILEFEILATDDGPQAGIGMTSALCEGEIVDLFDFLEGPFDTYGYWEETSESNSLTGNYWTTTGLPTGEYEFNYIVPGLCAGEDSTNVVINLSSPQVPLGEPLQAFCEGDLPKVSELKADGENITWYLQAVGGSALSPDEVLLDNTLYFAEQFVDGCKSTRFETKVTIEETIQNNEIGQDQTINKDDVPEPLTGSVPTGGSDIYEYQWQKSTDSLIWENIPGANQQHFSPEAIKENVYYRRIINGVCTAYISNSIEITVKSVDMSVTKTSFNKEIFDGDKFNYEIYIENSGLYDASSVVISDQLPSNLVYIGSEIIASSQEIEVSTATDDRIISWNIPNFPKGESLTIRLEVSAIEEGPVINSVGIDSKEEDENPSDNTASDQNKVRPMFIPNVIKPDNDGKNEFFIIRSLDKFQKIDLVIFNRWGDHIYESLDYKNDWAAEGLNSGTYYYVIKATDIQEREKIYKGWIQVIKNSR
ncbi:MAG: gliding motility-associated C-terminal domain-containing protein [Anditalea sp.]